MMRNMKTLKSTQRLAVLVGIPSPHGPQTGQTALMLHSAKSQDMLTLIQQCTKRYVVSIKYNEQSYSETLRHDCEHSISVCIVI